MKKWISMFVIFLGAFMSFGQTVNKGPHPSISAAFLSGGQVTTKTFYFNSGFGVYSMLHTDLGKRVTGGVGLGFEKLQDENFIPFLAEIRGKLREENGGGSLLVQGGYSLASNSKYDHYVGYEYAGGPLFAAGWGYFWPIQKSLLGLSVLFKQQYARLSFTGSGDSEVTDRITHSLLTIRTTFQF